MKKYILISTVIFMSLISSCSDFLKETDKDQLRPSTTEHFTALILGEMKAFELFMGVDYLTDNVQGVANSLQESRETKWGIFTWQREMELDRNGEDAQSTSDVAWQYLYKKIAVMNYVIDFADESVGSDIEKKSVKASAIFIRAYCYFNLTNLYGIPYNEATAKVDLGVPLRINTGIEQTYNRASVSESYDLIISDLLTAKNLYAESGVERSKWHPSEMACDLLLSRAYLYTENWDKTIDYATNVIDKGELSVMVSNTPFITSENKDVIYSISTRQPMTAESSDGLWVANDLYYLYNDNDLRRAAFFQSKLAGSTYNHFPRKYSRVSMASDASSVYSSLGIYNLRVSEAYLNRAEAYAHKKEDTKATADITTLLTKRYTSVDDIVIDNQGDVLSMVLLERRKELCFEECHRWFDLRRMKNRPEIVHVYGLTDESGNIMGEEVYTLFSNDQNYTLGIPLKERENNPLIRNNERLEKLPL